MIRITSNLYKILYHTYNILKFLETLYLIFSLSLSVAAPDASLKVAGTVLTINVVVARVHIGVAIAIIVRSLAVPIVAVGIKVTVSGAVVVTIREIAVAIVEPDVSSGGDKEEEHGKDDELVHFEGGGIVLCSGFCYFEELK